MNIDLKKQENGVITATLTIEDADKTIEGSGLNVIETLQDLIYHIQSEQMDEVEQYKHHLAAKKPVAVKMFSELYQLMGTTWFPLFQLENKLGGEPKDLVLLKLNYLAQFGLVETDRESGAGQRFRFVVDSEETINILKIEQDKLKEGADKAISKIQILIDSHKNGDFKPALNEAGTN